MDGMRRVAGRVVYWLAVVLVALGLVIGVLLLLAARDEPSLSAALAARA